MEFTWVRLPVHLIGSLSPKALILLSLLLNCETGSRTVKFRQRDFAEKLRVSVRCIDSLLRELEQAGLILSRSRMQSGTCITLKPDILPPRRTAAEGKPLRKELADAPERSSSIRDDVVARLMDPYGAMQET